MRRLMPGQDTIGAMPRPPGSLRARLAAARARHRERHRPSGFGFALADSIDYLDAATWDAVSAGQSLFLQRRYLGALERACPDNLAPRYALILDRKSTRLNSSHLVISYAVFCLKKKKKHKTNY